MLAVASRGRAAGSMSREEISIGGMLVSRGDREGLLSREAMSTGGTNGSNGTGEKLEGGAEGLKGSGRGLMGDVVSTVSVWGSMGDKEMISGTGSGLGSSSSTSVWLSRA